MATPYCLAMVICDGAHRDPSTNKYTILGTFSTIAAASYPTHAKMCVYFAVTDGIGPVTLCIQLIDAESGVIDARADGEVEGRLFSIKTEVQFPSPFAVVEAALGIDITLPRPGQYHCELWADDELLMSRRLIAGVVDSNEKSNEGE